MTTSHKRKLPAEWEPQDGILLAWPHDKTDWQASLAEVEPVFVAIAREISRFEQVVILAPATNVIKDRLREAAADLDRVVIREVATNDTWARDFAPITVLEKGRPLLVDFGFNGWGLKFPACHDNMAGRRLYAQGVFGTTAMETSGLILEGGSIESDGDGTLLTTSNCLLGPNRNPHLGKEEIEQALCHTLGGETIHWLQHGLLEGDDTDAHIDTIARFCPQDTICYVRCDVPGDSHFQEFAAMAEELSAFRTRDDRPYRLLPLPWPSPRYDGAGDRLPATYANFLVLNGAVLVPTYGDRKDGLALEIIGEAFPGRQVTGINCLPLIQQHGSLHCLTMQIPKGVLP